MYEKCEDNKELQEKSEEGFLFLTDRSNCFLASSHNSCVCRSEVWRTQKPVYVTKGEKVAKGVEGIDVNFRARSKSLFPESYKKRFDMCGLFMDFLDN